MCGSVTKVEQGRVTIYVSYDVAEELPEAEDGYLVIRMGPEAEVTFGMKDLRVKSEVIYHSGCRWATDSCERQSYEHSLSNN